MARLALLISLCSATVLAQQPPPSPVLGEPQPRPDSTVPAPLPDLSSHTVVLSVDDGYHSIFAHVYPLLKKHGMTMTLGVITDYVRPGTPSYQPSARFMNRGEVQELLDSCGIEVASHSLSHPFLTRLDSASAWREIRESKTMLESLFGREVITFIYPYGDMDARVRRMVKKAGYKLGRAVRPGEPNLWADPYRLPVVELRKETRLESIKNRITQRRTTILLLHQIVPEPAVFTEWNLTDFTELVQWMKQCQVQVKTLARLYREWWYERLGRFVEEVASAYPSSRKRLLFEDVDVDATQALHPR